MRIHIAEGSLSRGKGGVALFVRVRVSFRVRV